MKKSIILGTAGLIIGASAMATVVGTVPSVANYLSGTNNHEITDLSKEDLQLSAENKRLSDENKSLSQENEALMTENTTLRNEVLQLNNSINTISQQIATYREDLSSAETSITAKNLQIENLNGTIATLNSEISELENSIATYEELVGSDIVYLELVQTLQSQLTEKTELLNSATAELDTLNTELEELTAQVEELQLQLAIAEEKLVGYETMENIDKLNVDNFDGVWYLNGTFFDYYTISGGVVTHNANEDKGLLSPIYNQMYMMMNTAGGLAVDMSDDGISFTTADNKTYTKFYINTYVDTITNIYDVCGTYNTSDETIKINSDHTLEYTRDDVTYHGAYTVSSNLKNFGGNQTIINFIVATINIDKDTQEIRTFKTISRDNRLISTDDYSVDSYTKVAGFTGVLLGNSSGTNIPQDNYYKFVVKLDKPFNFQNCNYATFHFRYGGSIKNLSINGSNYNNYNGYSNFSLYDISSDRKSYDIFEFRFSDVNCFSILKDFSYVSSSFSEKFYIDSILDFEIVGNPTPINLSDLNNMGIIKNLYQKYLSTPGYISCAPVYNYLPAICRDDVLASSSINIEQCEIHYFGSFEECTLEYDGCSYNCTSYDVSAKTDGTDIYQTFTFSFEDYFSSDITHIVVLELKNYDVISSTFDGESANFRRLY